ncbi:FtsX-like permease family protein [Lacticaseibacillus parakribbianus]|uniref:FtsX-like permease family protein n=1 Tax=Lacticaseibacillus parakribbianus TaxID=2970927 RepID=UPI0021CB176F|nr:FtsX-like permease family protein [Lacticaseibacillus parakribbianus]
MIIAKISWQNLRQTPARTLLTILAMGVAATLAVASLVGLRSAQRSLFSYQRDQTQALIGFSDLTEKQRRSLTATNELVHQHQFVTTGTARLGKNKLPAVVVTPATMRQLGPALLSSGRLPRRATEALLADNWLGGHAKLGDWLTIRQNGQRRRIRVVGTMSPYNRSYLTTGGLLQQQSRLPAGRYGLLADLTATQNARARVAALATKAGVTASHYQLNDDALAVMGEANKRQTRLIIIGTVAGVLAVISVAALLLIYTSINLTVQAYRTRYGLLRSLGTTPKQLRHIVLSEALMLLAPALLLGFGFGIGGMAVTLGWLNRLFVHSDFAFALHLTVDWLPLTVAAVFMAAVTLIAAARPAWRASRVSPIAAIRAQAASPKVSKRRLRPGFWLRHVEQPTLRLALRNYRRTDRKATMMVTLVVTVALFVGLTGFSANFLRDYGTTDGADITATTGGNQLQAMSRTLQATGAVEQQLVAQHLGLDVKQGPLFLKGFDLSIYAVDATLARQLGHPLPLLVNTRVQTEDSKGRTVMTPTVPAGYHRPLTLRDPVSKKSVTVSPTIVPHRANTPEALVVDSNGEVGLFISRAQFKHWQQKLGLKTTNVTTVAAVKLRDANTHKQVAAAVKARVSGVNVIDAVAADQESYAITTMMRVLMSGFVALLALVSLATIANHTFADLMASRQSLAMMQSIGTTPGQLTAVKSLEYAFLMGQGLLYGGTLGAGVSYGLCMLLWQGTPDHPGYLWPTFGLATAAITIGLIWLAFVWATRRLLTHQDIDALIRRA